jgi:hypothetical protein
MSPRKYSSAVLATPIFSEAVGKATENLWPWILPKRVAAGSRCLCPRTWSTDPKSMKETWAAALSLAQSALVGCSRVRLDLQRQGEVKRCASIRVSGGP